MPNKDWGFGTPLAHFPELEGEIEDIFFTQYRDPDHEMQKKLDNLKKFKKIEKIVEEVGVDGNIIKKKLTIYVRYKNGRRDKNK
jgi:hypothetical protein